MCAGSVNPQKHKIERGDTLWGLAKYYEIKDWKTIWNHKNNREHNKWAGGDPKKLPIYKKELKKELFIPPSEAAIKAVDEARKSEEAAAWEMISVYDGLADLNDTTGKAINKAGLSARKLERLCDGFATTIEGFKSLPPAQLATTVKGLLPKVERTFSDQAKSAAAAVRKALTAANAKAQSLSKHGAGALGKGATSDAKAAADKQAAGGTKAAKTLAKALDALAKGFDTLAQEPSTNADMKKATALAATGDPKTRESALIALESLRQKVRQTVAGPLQTVRNANEACLTAAKGAKSEANAAARRAKIWTAKAK